VRGTEVLCGQLETKAREKKKKTDEERKKMGEGGGMRRSSINSYFQKQNDGRE